MRKTKRARMSVEGRRDQILDSAVGLILATGLSNCTLEAVAAEAGISKALIYKHFSSREDLLGALVHREFQMLRGYGLREIPADLSYEDIVRSSYQRAFDYFYERGPIVRALFAERSIVEQLGPHDREERAAMTEFWVERTMRAFDVPERIAQIGTIMNVNAPAAAARRLRHAGLDPKLVANVWSTFTIGGWNAVAQEYGNKAKPQRAAKPKQKQPYKLAKLRKL
jgi:AcrR family transcriptional regulator